MKKFLAVVLCVVSILAFMTACGNNSQNNQDNSSSGNNSVANDGITAPKSDVEMQYMSVEDAAGVLDTDGYLFLDVRKAEDYDASHIPGAVSADMDAAKNGDFDAGVATMQAATDGVDDTLIVICYSGKSYAQATTNVLSALGYDMSKVYTLEGGFTAWTETYPDNVE